MLKLACQPLQTARRLPLLLAALTFLPLAHAATGTHLDGSTLYPRLIRLEHAHHGYKGAILAKTGNRLYTSRDDGQTFVYLATVPTTTDRSADEPLTNPASRPAITSDTERCCSTLYELPRKVGKLRAGTLLYAASMFAGTTPAIDIFTSSDEGQHWQWLAQPMKAGDQKHGLWEPAFTLARDGSLVIFVSDETDPCCSQKLVQMRTRDGLSWSSKTDTVAVANPQDRPGMAIVSQLPDHRFVMTYEVCGPTAHCQVFFRTSADGWHFGDPASLGTRVVSSTGQYLAHAPTNILLPRAGTLLVAGQMVYEADGTLSPQNGRILFTLAASDLAAAWNTIPAPVAIPHAYDNYCPNYSSALLPVSGGTSLLELASDYDRPHHCTSYFATDPLPASVTQPVAH